MNKGAPVMHVARFFVFRSRLFVQHVSDMAKSLTERFRNCVTLCHSFRTPEDTHDLCVMCLGEEHMYSVLKGAEYAHCGKFSMKKLRVSSFVHFPIFKGCETGILQLRSRCCQGMAEQPGVERGKMLMGKECNLSNSPIPESLNLGLTRKPYVYNSYSLHFLIL